MAITIQNTNPPLERIYARQPEAEPDLASLREQLKQLMQRGRLTSRDERLLEYLAELSVLSLEQVGRLLWPAEATTKTVYERLRKLANHRLLSCPRTPRAEMRDWGLQLGKVYALGPLGQLWLTDEVDGGYKPRHFKRNQVLHDLLVSELAVRMSETATRRGPGWAFSWAGESAASFYPNEYDPPLIAPDGLGVLRRQQAVLPFFVEVDAGRQGHGRYSSDWGRKLVGYDRFVSSRWRAHPELGHLPAFPVVLVVTHGAERLLNLARAIIDKRKQPVIYYLALWDDLLDAGDLFAAPIWTVVTAEGIVGEQPEERQPLIITGEE